MNRRSVWSGLQLCLLVAACSRDDVARTVETLRIAVLPDQSEALLRIKYQPLLNYIETHTGLHCELLIPESYAQLLQRLGGNYYIPAGHGDFSRLEQVILDLDQQQAVP